MWIQFTAKFCWKANDAVNIVFKPDGGPFNDGRYPVTRGCAADAIVKGAAAHTETPARPR